MYKVEDLTSIINNRSESIKISDSSLSHLADTLRSAHEFKE